MSIVAIQSSPSFISTVHVHLLIENMLLNAVQKAQQKDRHAAIVSDMLGLQNFLLGEFITGEREEKVVPNEPVGESEPDLLSGKLTQIKNRTSLFCTQIKDKEKEGKRAKKANKENKESKENKEKKEKKESKESKETLKENKESKETLKENEVLMMKLKKEYQLLLKNVSRKPVELPNIHRHTEEEDNLRKGKEKKKMSIPPSQAILPIPSLGTTAKTTLNRLSVLEYLDQVDSAQCSKPETREERSRQKEQSRVKPTARQTNLKTVLQHKEKVKMNLARKSITIHEEGVDACKQQDFSAALKGRLQTKRSVWIREIEQGLQL